MSSFINNQDITDLLIANGWAWRFEYTVNVGAGATVYVGFTTGDKGAIIHDRAFDTEGADTLFTLYRGTSYTGGVAYTLANRNDRWWAVTDRRPMTDVKTGVIAVPSPANAMGSIRLWSTGAPAVNIASESNHIILAPNSSYVVAITNNDAGAQDCAMSLVLMRDVISTGIIEWP
jgi:hypothetical protein